MRRKQGALVPLEISILAMALDLRTRGVPEFHGFLLAKVMKERGETRRLADYGTLYRALERLEKAGLLASWWEDPQIAAQERRPLRRLYQVTATAAEALSKVQTSAASGQLAWLAGRVAT